MASSSPATPNLSPRFRAQLRIYFDNEIAFGPGKADLLDAIKATGSISAAGKQLNMSYRRAWLLVDTMNRCFESPLVATAKGGSSGGGATLSELGIEILTQFRAMEAEVMQTCTPYFRKIKSSLRAI